MSSEDNFDTTIRFRAPGTLKGRIERIARRRVKTFTECGREAMVRFVEEQEKALNLPPIEMVPSAVQVGGDGEKGGRG